MNRARIAWALVAALGVLANPSARAAAQDDAPPALEDIALMLGSPDPDEVQRAIEATAVSGDPEVIALLRQRIREGLPTVLLGAALDSLGLLADPASVDIFAELTRHRSPQIRVRAVLGLASLGTQHAEASRPALQRALSDSDPEVRGAAAQGLGELGDRSALPLLFQAFEVGIPHSGAALAQLAGPEELDRVLGYLGAYPLDNVLPIVLGLMQRADLSDKAKLRIVAQVQDVATAQARVALERVSNMDPERVSARVRRSAQEAAARISN